MMLSAADESVMKPGGPSEHRPTPMAHTVSPAPQLQLQVAMRALVDVLNHSDNGLQAGVIRELEQRTGLTVRTAEQEVALRRLARLADVEADKGMAEEISLPQTCGTPPTSWNSGSGLASRCAAPRSWTSSHEATRTALETSRRAAACQFTRGTSTAGRLGMQSFSHGQTRTMGRTQRSKTCLM